MGEKKSVAIQCCSVGRTGTAVRCHLLFTCHTCPHLTLVSCSKTTSVSAPRTRILELILQYKCRLSVKYSTSVYSAILEQ